MLRSAAQRLSHSQFSVLAGISRHVRTTTVHVQNGSASALLSFDNGQSCYSTKSTVDILRALIVFKLCRNRAFVRNAEQWMVLGARLIPRPTFRAMMRSTFYKQFVAGEELDDVSAVCRTLSAAGVQSMLMVPIECISESTASVREEVYSKNMKTIVDCVERSAKIQKRGFSQMKITSVASSTLLRTLNKALQKENHAWNLPDMLRCFEGTSIPIDFDVDESTWSQLRSLWSRLDSLAELCSRRSVRLMIDAEQTYMQRAIQLLVLLLQSRYNRSEEPTVYTTYQCYLKDTLTRIKTDHDTARRQGFKLSAKFVRGAYMDEERALAERLNYPSPVHDTFQHTSSTYDACVNFALPLTKSKEFGLMIATHNERAVLSAVHRMQELGIDRRCPLVCFGQIYGMCDHVSFALGHAGYQVFKSIPYGSLDATLPYLSRRAKENKAILEGARRDHELLYAELCRRLSRKPSQ